MISGGLHTVFARLFVRGLVAAGVRAAIVSPGSRSTPLALAFASERDLDVIVSIDERVAGFMALGRARVTGEPTVVVTTSGTAGAHHHPAVLEADRAKIPLIVVTADRPPELAHAHASQTVDQTKLFGAHVRLSLDLGLPSEASLAAAQRIAAHAALASLGPDPGPVHVNAPFRKPLEPTADDGAEPWTARAAAVFARPAPRVFAGAARASEAAVSEVAASLRAAARPLVVLGPRWGSAGVPAAERDRALSAAASRLAALGIAVAAEATSGALDAESILPGAALAETGALTGALAPDVIVAAGMPPVSPTLAALAAPAKIVVAPAGFPDPESVATALVHGDAAELLGRVASGLAASPPWRAYRERLAAASAAGAGALADEAGPDTLSEPFVLASVADLLPRGSTLAIGNSLVVRDLDLFGAPKLRGVTVLHQRGAAGIDGLVAGAVGARTAVAPSSPVALVLGDVSALHDVGALAALRDVRSVLAIVVVDNAGGRIFESLPVAKQAPLGAAFERLFLTPPPPFLEGAARAFGVGYTRIEHPHMLAPALATALATQAASILHVLVPPNDGTSRRARAKSRAKEAAAQELARHG
ncbi:MAG TPA: 2-succinyl-5-enolpyruvyl-6-hydroxy-3-cyclohexene-1-carboxylic-acid synthase [Polyangiaceae bacterium]|nr:2-succinyl-5-enolpyruvyl-6-hydroxy-3-cyclohexene-1-carboxylic-acid synthase [Polyangiaceae bacterium]